jgi:hypothetical protein
MLPIVYPGRIANAKSSEAADKARKGLEVTRSFVVDKTGKRLLIHAVNGGIPQIKEEESVVTHKPAEREIGTLHTHPNYDNLPSSGDIFNFLYHKREIGFIVTQLRVIACFRTSNTPTFTNPIIAKGYLEGMGKAKRRELSKSGIWTLNYSDLNELHLATYEAERGSNVFSRKDNIK